MFSQTTSDSWENSGNTMDFHKQQQHTHSGNTERFKQPTSLLKQSQLDPLFDRLPTPTQQHNNGLVFYKTHSSTEPLPSYNRNVSLPPLASLVTLPKRPELFSSLPPISSLCSSLPPISGVIVIEPVVSRSLIGSPDNLNYQAAPLNNSANLNYQDASLNNTANLNYQASPMNSRTNLNYQAATLYNTSFLNCQSSTQFGFNKDQVQTNFNQIHSPSDLTTALAPQKLSSVVIPLWIQSAQRSVTYPTLLKTPAQSFHLEEFSDDDTTQHFQLIDPSSIAVHEDSITAAKTYICPFCQQSHQSLDSIQIHIRTHSAQQLFPCYHKQCPARFARSHDLTRHLKTHSADRPFVCKLCGRGFARRDALKRHEKLGLMDGRMGCDGRRKGVLPKNRRKEDGEFVVSRALDDKIPVNLSTFQQDHQN
ncbi:hypothetical protein HK096_008431, partial [Nowakowskiella sp. JEL0078]